MDVLAAEVGYACNVNEDCDSGDCLHYGGQAACTTDCNVVTKSGCPEEDLDGDGVVDEFECLILSTEGKCWRTSGPFVLPEEPEPPESTGCSCAFNADQRLSHVLLNALVWLFVLLFRSGQRRRRLFG